MTAEDCGGAKTDDLKPRAPTPDADTLFTDPDLESPGFRHSER